MLAPMPNRDPKISRRKSRRRWIKLGVWLTLAGMFAWYAYVRATTLPAGYVDGAPPPLPQPAAVTRLAEQLSDSSIVQPRVDIRQFANFSATDDNAWIILLGDPWPVDASASDDRLCERGLLRWRAPSFSCRL